jgi:hypothetical protein
MGLALAMVIAIPVVASGGVLAAFLLSSGDGRSSPGDRCSFARQAGEFAVADAGTVVVAKGEVAGVRNAGAGLLLDLGRPHPDESLTVLIRESSIENWTLPPQQQYTGRVIALGGELELLDGSLQVEARSPRDLVICG